MNKKSSLWMAGVALAGLLNGCGSESGAPAGSTIEISPAPKEWVVDINSLSSFVDQPVLVVVKGPNGAPINDVDITVSLDLAPGTVPLGDEAMFLFEDDNQDGVPDCRFDPVSPCPVPPQFPVLTDLSVGALALPYRTKVDAFGRKQFVLRMSIGFYITYRGLLNIVSGSVSATGEFIHSCSDSDTANPPDCP